MVAKGLPEMITSVWRFSRYRYVIVAALLINVVLINHFFFDTSFTSSLSPFKSAKNDVEPEKAPTPAGGSPSVSQAAPIVAEDSGTPIVPQQPSNVNLALATAEPYRAGLVNLHDYDFDGPYVGWPLGRVCNETKFQPGLVFVCDNNSGGIGNIRNFILTCIRYAIDAGASGIIMPGIQRRSEEDLANIFTTKIQPFDYFFDPEHFLSAMSTFCPQIKVYKEAKDIPGKVLAVNEFYPKDLNVDLDGCDGRGINRHLDQFRTKFDAWLEKEKRKPSLKEPITIRFKWATFFEWPIYRDGPEFATTFGDLLRIRKDIQELAAITLREMATFVGTAPVETTKLNAPFLGVHLRTESDALGFWPNFDEQSGGYLEQAKEYRLKHAYLACGDAAEGHRFAQRALETVQLNVTSKLDLLKGNDLKRLTDLSWDQQALVDFLVLTKSAHFTGCSFSSFTMNIEFKRHLMTDGIHTRQWRSPGDIYSTLVGRFESWYGVWMFMYECMCP